MSEWLASLIHESDVRVASRLMGLGPDGFAPVGDDDSRLQAMLTLDSADFEACPGSGKTTLLVAKLAVLAMRWPHRQQGICVLSHTNAARNEIGTRLSSSAAGIALLRYPHFVGTIHSFVNEFLAVPWLRSKGNSVRVIDTQVALRQRMGSLAPKWRYAIQQRNLKPYCLIYERPDYTGDNKGGLGPATSTYQALVGVARRSSEQGFYCFDEMFVWANELLDARPDVAQTLRRRFPLIFIDEAQDNSKEQAALLHRIFTDGDAPSRRQRFGDSNQAIYSRPEQVGAQIDQFPSPPIHTLPRSYRFGQVLADQVKGLGVLPHPLIGAGPANAQGRTEPLPSVLFLFDDQSINEVLPRYGAHLVTNFDTAALSRGIYTAVAGVHKLEKDANLPRAIGHYAPTYNAAYARKESAPETFLQYFAKARVKLVESLNTHSIVNALASALVATSNLLGTAPPPMSRKSAHRRMIETLEGASAAADYAWLVEHVIAVRGALREDEWQASILPRVFAIVTTLSNAPYLTPEAERFLAWPADHAVHHEDAASTAPQVNVFAYPPDAPKVHVRLGSIHSVKGETHTATLVLESFFHQHHLSELKPWLLGEREGGFRQGARGKTMPEGTRMLGRLKLHYVAMTRPTHLLCLAMRKDAFSDTELNRLTQRGWKIVDCCASEGG
ncbi:UvrD-helicase domain-containing protein [Pseudoxanthomonas sp.]|uniref:UvrD-helicase domain-containing protein n=1 Tax=Pseudoxanthomonas sp. TaxID=1871049 RepID=UPI0026392527|nr:UvrD-helicase domain-containing protein [Pseudoxanthomonas sp.]WDS37831.1 MAG: UvrD-helicase domain-containing protein [Pseudoxanthomonas sp.]